MDAETNQSGFEIDGKFYELPGLETFNMDEYQVLYDYSGLIIEDFASNPDETEEETTERENRFKNPGLLRALMHVSYQRGNPSLRAAKVKTLIGGANVLTTIESLFSNPEEDEVDPPASTTEPEPSSPKDSVVSSKSSGDDSANGSDPPDKTPEATGTGRSDTSSQASPPTLSAV